MATALGVLIVELFSWDTAPTIKGVDFGRRNTTNPIMRLRSLFLELNQVCSVLRSGRVSKPILQRNKRQATLHLTWKILARATIPGFLCQTSKRFKETKYLKIVFTSKAFKANTQFLRELRGHVQNRTMGYYSFLAACGTDGTNQPIREGVVVTAVGRLPPPHAPPRRFRTARNLAPYSEVDHWATQTIALMAGTYSGGSFGQHTPPRPLRARDM